MKRFQRSIPYAFVLVIVGIAALALMAIESNGDDGNYPFECVPELGLNHIEAHSVYVGKTDTTPAYWDVPDDTIMKYRYNNQWVDTFRIYYSASADEHYAFVFDKEPVYEWNEVEQSWGWGWHPCGQGALSADDYLEAVG